MKKKKEKTTFSQELLRRLSIRGACRADLNFKARPAEFHEAPPRMRAGEVTFMMEEPLFFKEVPLVAGVMIEAARLRLVESINYQAIICCCRMITNIYICLIWPGRDGS